MAKSQAELESPAKVYQVDAVAGSVQGLREDVSELKDLIKDIQKSVSGVATIAYVSSLVEKAEIDIKEYVDKEISDAKDSIHSTYAPMQKEHEWVKYTVIGGILFQLLLGGILWIVTRGS